jgi:signal transduction histidine kinase
MDSVTDREDVVTAGEPAVTGSSPGSVSTLVALRRSREQRLAVVSRRARRFGTAAALIWAFVACRSGPEPGLHGTRLAIGLLILCFLGSILLLVQRGTVLAGVPLPGMKPRASLPLLAVLALSAGALQLLQPTGPGFVGLFILVTVAGRVCSRRVSVAVLTACLVYLIVLGATGLSTWHGMTGFVGLFALVAVYITSLFARRVRAQEEQEERLLEQLEESRRAELRAAALGERQRLAREMHDVLAHSLSGLVVQLEGARLLAATSPGDERLPGAVDRAHQLARSGLDEARQAIGMLRGDELPGPGRLAELAREFAADTGVRCEFTEAGTPRELAPAVRLALYRVTQEGLTNVRKHARPDRVAVRLEYRPAEVTLVIQDCGGLGGVQPAAAREDCSVVRGYGLTGMRERAGLLGGTLDAGPTADGFRVLLRVPA